MWRRTAGRAYVGQRQRSCKAIARAWFSRGHELLEARQYLAGDVALGWPDTVVEQTTLADEPTASSGSELVGPIRESTALSVQPRIVGGEPAAAGVWPWMVSLQDPASGHFCGGSLIASDLVVTAAHCVTDFFGDVVAPSSMTAVLGLQKLSSNTGERFSIAEIVVHPNFNPFTLDSDIAVLVLDHASSATPIPYVRNADQSLFAPGQPATVIGWGQLDSNDFSLPDELQQVTVPFVSNEVANDPAAYDGQVTDNMLAAGVPEGGIDSCYGDSGGPLMVRDAGGKYRLAGVVSWGNDCGQPGYPGIYTRVANFAPWLDGFFLGGPDRFEANDSAVAAADLATGDLTLRELSIHSPADSDWFRWTASEPGEVTITVTPSDESVDLDLALYSPEGKLLTTATSSDHAETIRYTVAKKGDAVVLHVYGAGRVSRAAYSLEIDGPGALKPDLSEPNEAIDAATALPDGLSISRNLHLGSDVDWYHWNSEDLPEQATARLTFNSRIGSMEMMLFDSSGVPVMPAVMRENALELNWKTTPDTDYFLRVVSPHGDIQPAYTLRLDTSIPVDVFEPNDVSNAAADLGVGDRTISKASLHVDSDVDWYQWTAGLRGNTRLTLNYDPLSFGGIDLSVRDSNGEELAFLDGLFDGPGSVTWTALAGRTYYFVLTSSFFDPVPAYSLSVDGPGVVPVDALEPNQDAAQAVVAGASTASFSQLTLPLGDEDWFQWDPQAAASVTARVDYNPLLASLLIEAIDGQGRILGASTTDAHGAQLTVSEGLGVAPVYFRVTQKSGTPYGYYGLSIQPFFKPDSWEPNESIAEAGNLFSVSHWQQALSLDTKEDEDWFEWMATQDGNLILHADPLGGQSKLDVEVYDQRHRLVAVMSDGTTPGALSLPVLSGRKYFVRVLASDDEPVGRYSLTLDGPGTILPDSTESNQTPETATAISTFGGQLAGLTLHDSQDVDWFKWQASSEATVDLALAFRNGLGNVDLLAYDANQKLLAASTTQGDRESLQLKVAEGQQILIKVVGHDGAVQPSYNLTVAPRYPSDRFEPNNSRFSAFDLITGDRRLNGLSLDRGGDEDWFHWTTPADGTAVFKLESRVAGQVLDMEIYSFGQLLYRSPVLGATKQQSFNLFEGDEFDIRIYSRQNVAYPNYNFAIDGPGTVPPDASEPNNERAKATPISGSLSDLSLHSTTDKDWFTWTAAGQGRVTVDAQFQESLGSLDLLVQDSSGRTVAASGGSGNRQTAAWDFRDGQTYYIQVYSFSGQVQPKYRLDLSVSYQLDVFEANDDRAGAFDLGRGNLDLIDLSLHASHNEDWFVWSPIEAGSTTARINFDHDLGNINLDVYDERGVRLGGSSSTSSDNEQVTWSAETGKRYWVRVFGQGAATSPRYSLKLTGSGVVPPDTAEPNNALGAAVHIPVRGLSLSPGTLHRPDDTDWFVWESPYAGTLDVQLDYIRQLGAVTVTAYDAHGQVLSQALSDSGHHTESLSFSAGQQIRFVIASPSQDIVGQYAFAVTPHYTADSAEPNNGPDTATQLSALGGQVEDFSLHDSADADWFRWQAVADSAASVLVSTVDNLPVQVAVATGNGETVVAGSSGSRLAWDAQAGVDYFIRIEGGATPSYDMVLRPAFTADRFEPNNTDSQAVDLVTGNVSLTDLSLHQAGDQDWFRWHAQSDGDISLSVKGKTGDSALKVVVIDRQGAVVTQGAPDATRVTAMWHATANQEFRIQVVDAGGVVQPAYDLTITAPGGLLPDAWEANNSASTAVVLRDWVFVGANQLTGLNLHQSNDEDWFRWDATDNHQFIATVNYDPRLGGVDLLFYDSNQRLLTVSAGDTGQQQVAWNVQAGKSYFIRTMTVGGNIQPAYSLSVDGTLSYRRGDLNHDNAVNGDDVDLLMAAVARQANEPQWDVNGDGSVKGDDVTYLVEDLLHTTAGDLNLDGRADSLDILDFLSNWTAEADPGTHSAGWRQGDRDGDGDVDSSDLLFLMSVWPVRT